MGQESAVHSGVRGRHVVATVDGSGDDGSVVEHVAARAYLGRGDPIGISSRYG